MAGTRPEPSEASSGAQLTEGYKEDRILASLFPGLATPRTDGETFYRVAWPTVVCSFYDLEGMIENREWLQGHDLIVALCYFLSGLEDQVYIHNTWISNSSSVHPPETNLNTRRVMASKRFWVILGTKDLSHWILTIYDQARHTTVYFDSLRYRARDTNLYQLKIISWIQASSLYPGNTKPEVYKRGPVQSEDWECGVWVLEYARLFFQEGLQAGGIYEAPP
ncbi:hypothetical protein BT67DRAFT_436405 [Trichocladium antarcticum]|uniref:Ubiquitin-like protease family profile domain-containing protein n=1 Tax=Trichocladium antarcticum TaxID=1450529 RepID=A0AAN6ZAN0_9PEZI|nr:hypothetical protein BT67DRAFT_436405 [Trichocladium antarcticum]